MQNPTLIKSLVCGAAVAAYRIVKHGAADDKVVQGAAATDALIGISDNLGGAVDKRVDVILEGVAEVEYGGNVTRGEPLTSDADGKAVAAAPAQGANNRIIGFAMVSGVLGDIGSCRIAPGVMQGA